MTDDFDFDQPFTVDPILPGVVMSANDVHARVDIVDGGQDVHAWLTDHPKHPLTGDDIVPTTCRLELPGGRLPDGLKREAFHLLDPKTNRGVALAIHPQTGEIIGWYAASVATVNDLELGVPQEWLDE